MSIDRARFTDMTPDGFRYAARELDHAALARQLFDTMDPDGARKAQIESGFAHRLSQQEIALAAILLYRIRRFSGLGETVLEHTGNMLGMHEAILALYPDVQTGLSAHDLTVVTRKIAIHDLGEAVFDDADYTVTESSTVNHTHRSRAWWDRRERRATVAVLSNVSDPTLRRALAAEYVSYEQRDENRQADNRYVRWLDVMDGQLGYREVFPGAIDEAMLRKNLNRVWQASAPLIREQPAMAASIRTVTEAMLASNPTYRDHPAIAGIFLAFNQEHGTDLGLLETEQAARLIGPLIADRRIIPQDLLYTSDQS